VATLAPALAVFMDTNGQPAFNLTGAAGRQYVIQSSTNLVNWRSVATNEVPLHGIVPLPSFLATNNGARFFRALLR
jgi:hypothetical protein